MINTRIGSFSSSCALLLIGGVGATGCGGAVDTPSEQTNQVGSDLYQDDQGGSADRFAATFINVCFEDTVTGDSAPTAAQAALIRRAIENSWMRFSALTFVGWGTCSSTYGIHIHLQNASAAPTNYSFTAGGVTNVANTSGGCSSAGYGWPCSDIGPAHSDGAHIDLTTDYTAQSASFGGCLGNATNTNQCIMTDAVHEFGHALGFRHEQERPDNTCPGKADTGSGGGIELTAYDGESVMNYCSTPREHDGNLTASDIYGVQRVYGRKAPGSMVSFDGRCLDIAGGGSVDGHSAQTWDCLGGTQFSQADQNWYFIPSDGRIGMYSNPRALDVANASTTNGALVQDWDLLTNAVSQTWSFTDAQILSLGAMCVDVPGFSTTNGTQIQLWTCSGTTDIPSTANWGTPSTLNVTRPAVSDNEKFTLDATGHLRLTGPFYAGEKCLAVLNGTSTNGTPIALEDCATTSAQQFVLEAAGTIQAFNGTQNKCIDIGLSNLTTFDGTPGQYKLDVWDCNGQINQQFALFGQVHVLGTQCLDVAGWGRADGTQVWSWACDPVSAMSTKQAWQFYW